MFRKWPMDDSTTKQNVGQLPNWLSSNSRVWRLPSHPASDTRPRIPARPPVDLKLHKYETTVESH